MTSLLVHKKINPIHKSGKSKLNIMLSKMSQQQWCVCVEIL